MVMQRFRPRFFTPLAAVALAIGVGGCSLIPVETLQHALGDAANALTASSPPEDAAAATPLASTAPDRLSASNPGTIKPAVSPMPPGTALDISSQDPQPGEYFDFQMCTAAWSFTLEDGRTFAVTASHCGQVGDRVWAGNAHRTFTYPAEPVGEVVYSDLFAEDGHGLDVAFIELHGDVGYYTPKYMEANLATTEELPQQLCKLGRITGETCGELTHGPEKSGLNAGDTRLETTAARARICGTQGDSGGPIYASLPGGNAVIGVVSGTTKQIQENHDCSDHPDMELSFTPAADIFELIPQVLGSEVAQAQ